MCKQNKRFGLRLGEKEMLAKNPQTTQTALGFHPTQVYRSNGESSKPAREWDWEKKKSVEEILAVLSDGKTTSLLQTHKRCPQSISDLRLAPRIPAE